MADGVTLNLGSGGSVVATDDIASAHYQRVKLTDGTADSTTTIEAGGGVEAGALRVTVASDSTGVLSVDDNGGSLTVDGTVAVSSLPALAAGTENIGDVDVLSVPAPLSTTGNGTAATALRVTLASDSTGVIAVTDNAGSLTVDGTVAVSSLPALAAGTANIGDVDVLTVPAPLSTTGGGTEATALRVTIASDSTGVVSIDDNAGSITVDGTVTATLAAGTNTNEVVGDVAHDAAASGNPVLVAGVAQDTDDTAPPNRVSAEADATRLATDRDGALYVRPHGPQVWSYHLDTSTAQTDATVHAAPGTGLALYVGTIAFSSGAATAINLFFEEGATKVLGPFYLEATAGRGMAIQFNPPKKITANTALTLTTSASIAHAVDVTGFTAPG